jgi:hypothetical protein
MRPPKFLCPPNIRALALFRSSEKQVNLKPNLSEIDPVSWAKIEPSFRDAFANRCNIAE